VTCASSSTRSKTRSPHFGKTLYTFGHGTASAQELAALIRGAALEHVVDVRTIPKSRRLPHVWEAEMARWVPELGGAAYSRSPALGGFRKQRPESPNTALRNPSFRAYADYMQTPAFVEALDTLLTDALLHKTAAVCSETLWWRCHRRLIADAAVLLRGVEVRHLMHDGTAKQHVLTAGVRRLGHDMLAYDVQAS